MDHEFHYYITRLTAARAGFSPEDAGIVAWSSQYTDDNDIIFKIDKDLPTEYRNYISQTINILKPQLKLIRIYSHFHFIPGSPEAPTARRKDGAMHRLNTTPDSKNANLVLNAALASGSLYRIGIACHAYADTWAHQNFIGYLNQFNAMAGTLVKAIPNIGHADARYEPDRVAFSWDDGRLINKRIDNNARFLKAAVCMYRKLARYADPGISGKEIHKRETKLKEDLSRCIGHDDPDNEYQKERIASYRKLSCEPEYGGKEIDTYDADLWMDEVVNEEVYGMRDRSDFALPSLNPLLKDYYSWKDREHYRETHWYLFQEAVKEHQKNTWMILENRNFKGLDLKDV